MLIVEELCDLSVLCGKIRFLIFGRIAVAPSSLADFLPSLQGRLKTLYGEEADAALAVMDAEFASLLAEPKKKPPTAPLWNERDVVLITYADQLRSDDGSTTPLALLRQWLVQNQLDQLLSTVHLLPFCPYTSDDGFSVIDYLEVDLEAGTWDDIAALGEPFDLMFDLVLNHISQKSEWFSAYKRGETPYDRFFIEVNPEADLSQVVRPRSLPLLTPVETNRGQQHVWTTFSDDQIDLNYDEPLVLARMLRILVEYAHRGARIVRLDAIAFLWKQLGTNCLHLKETHEATKIMRDVLSLFAPRTLVLTETNVPHAENISYFGSPGKEGQSDEAQMVYQFSLPPLLLEAFLSGNASAIRDWLTDLAPPPAGCTFFNFTASHDGIGVRPLEGLLSADRVAQLVESVKARGARINTRHQTDGTDIPYELCITYFSALRPEQPDDELHVRRFLASQAVMLSLQGMPAIYFHSLVGSPNDEAGADESGVHRRINRHKYTVGELDAALADDTATQRQVFDGYSDLIAKRIAEPAFHPDATQRVIETDSTTVLAFERQSLTGERRVLVMVNFSESQQSVHRPKAFQGKVTELITGEELEARDSLTLAPGQAVWLATSESVD